MLQGELMLAHLGENSANVKMDIAGVRDLQAIVDCRLTVVKVIILDLESLLKIRESTSQLLCSPEDACKVIVCYCSIPISFLCQ